MKKNARSEEPKRNILAFPGNGKGGTGKTFTVASLIDAALRAGVSVSAVDCDSENAEKPGALHRLVEATRYNLRSVGDCDALVQAAAASEARLTIADFPANAGGDFFGFAREIFQPDLLDALNLKVVNLAVITPEPASLASAIEWANVLEDRVDHVVVLNRRQIERVPRPLGETFSDYHSCGFREAAMPLEIELPALYEEAALRLSKAGRLPSRVEPGDMDLLNAARVRSFASATAKAWAPFFDRFGLGKEAE